MDTDPTPGAARPARPLVWLAGALGTGTLLGLDAAGWGAERSVAVVAPLALGGLLLARRGRVPAWAAWVLVLAFARGRGVERAPACPPPLGTLECEELRSTPVAGRWHARADGRTGWIEPFEGEPRAPGHALLFEPSAWVPPGGTPVAILPGSHVEPWARGPAPPPRARAERFAARTAVAPDELVRLGPSPRRPWTPLVDGMSELRAALGERAARVERAQSAGLLRALATGAREGLPRERVDLFARTGTSHLLAISGWHVGLFAALVVLPLARATPRARRGLVALGARMGLVLLFAGVAGAEKPVLRATLALFLLQLAWLLPRGTGRAESGAGLAEAPARPDGLSSLAAAFALECLLDPAGIDSLALALSYAATLGLILGTGAAAGLLRPRRERWGELRQGPARRIAVALGARLGAALASGLGASLAAVLATLPLTWATFGELAPAGALLTLLALPPFTFLSVLAWLAALLPWSGLGHLAEPGARALYAVLELGDALPWTPLVLPPRPLALLVTATVLAFAGLRGESAASRGARRGAALAWGVLLLPWSAAPRGLELHALDVGHGSAVVLRAPGLEALVFDAGSRDRPAVASEALLPLLARWEVAEVGLVLSHRDRDHASGLARLVRRFPIGSALGAEPAQELVRWPHGVPRLDLAPGRLRLASPCPVLELALLRGAPGEGNEGSRALELAWRGRRLLLLGDAEELGLDALPLAAGPLRLLLAPHHGSDAPALGGLLGRCPPEEVWISAAARPPIASELDRRALAWRWTGRDGPLALRLP